MSDQDRVGAPGAGAETTAEAFLAHLSARGVDWLFANSGTDFAPIIEAYCRAPVSELSFPTPVTVPHENAAVSMAHGFYLGSGRMQAVMVHVSVGIANSLCALLNAARENIPVFFAAGRSPLTESGDRASRDVYIHWGQEMFDQGGMLREIVRWDYELRLPEQVAVVVDRAIAVATSDPGGPVHLALPREILARPAATDVPAPRPLSPARATGIDPAAAEEAARILARAERPLIVTSRAGREEGAFEALARFAECAAIPVVEYIPNYANLPDDHAMHAGHDPGPGLAEADAILVLDTPVPWLPSRHEVPVQATVIQIAADPLYAGLPVRGFASDLSIVSRPGAALPALQAAFEHLTRDDGARMESRRARLASAHRAARTARREALLSGGTPPARMTAAWVTHCLDAARQPGDIVLDELGCVRELLQITRPGSFFGSSTAGGLGWAVPAALGLKMARPDRRVIACTGDGSLMFANPVACHQTAAAYGIATLTIVFNNRRWNAVRKSTLSVYPDGHAAGANRMPLTALEPSPGFHEICTACGGHGELVEDPAALPEALARALDEVDHGRFALLNVICD